MITCATALFAALDARTGQVIGQCHRRHRAVEFRKFLDAIESVVPAKSSCAVECIRAAANWRLPSTVTWTSPTKTPSPLSGPRPLTKSWPAWPVCADAL